MEHEAQMRRLYDGVNTRSTEGFIDLMAPDFVEHEPVPGLPATREGVVEFFEMFMAAFPDLRFDVEDMLSSGDKVVSRVRATGTHEGEFAGIPATGKRIDMQLIDIVRFSDDGLAVEHWGVSDNLGMLQQLGVVPDST